MSIEIKQQLKLSQSLVMTPQLQQAIKLLQLNRMELVELVREEMMENPILEDGVDTASEQTREQQAENQAEEMSGETEMAAPEAPGAANTETEVKGDAPSAVTEVDWESYLDSYSAGNAPSTGPRTQSEELPSLESTLTKKTSLFDHLQWQLSMMQISEEENRVGMAILGNLDQDGYLKEPPLEDIANECEVSVELAESVLKRIQLFDPVGVAARTLQECLLIQARHAEVDDDILVRIITHHLGNLEKKNYAAIAKDLKEPVEEIYEAAKALMEFDPRPGRQHSTDEPHYITPDVYIHKVGDKYFVVANDDGLPKLKISSFYRSALSGSPQAREYIQDKLRSAQWLIRSIQQRQRTIVKVTESIIKFQREFFEKGIAHLKPLILRDVAEDISMHESTISRVTTNKYVHTPQGIYELKFFFNSGINRIAGEDVASEAVKTKIKQLIAGENTKVPYSDQRLVELLRDQDIDIARRTVAKYREQLGILSSSKRRQVF
ncbi:MAG: RNA polymerase factor sigma-54 [Deltaproteobacteria bacterium]|nr:RNA polymerase factor sigma-54 [Deltaproteobacteria bacterium]